MEMIEEDAGFGAAATAVFDERAIGADDAGHVRDVAAHDLHLGAGEIVVVQLTNAVKQSGTFGVVEEFAREALGRCPQAGQDLLAKIVRGGSVVV